MYYMPARYGNLFDLHFPDQIKVQNKRESKIWFLKITKKEKKQMRN